jgi:peptide/nickel transport system permease protein
MLGERAPDAAIRQMHHHLGLDKPIWVQYGYWMSDMARLDLGTSQRYRVPVSSLIWSRLKVSLLVVLFTVTLTIAISLPLGILAALKRDSVFDTLVRSGLVVTMVMPSFWIGIIFIIVFGIRLGLFPVSGYGTGFFGHVKSLFLPSLTLALGLAPILIRSLRNGILQTLRADYTRTARAKGLSERSVITVHVLRNALIPSVTLLAISTGSLMGGTVITEKVFALPGAGALLIESITVRDYPVVQVLTLIFALMVILVNIATDVLYSFLDPRVRFN